LTRRRVLLVSALVVATAVATVIAFAAFRGQGLGCLRVQSAKELAFSDVRVQSSSGTTFEPGRVDSVLSPDAPRAEVFATTASRRLYVGGGHPFVWRARKTLTPGQLVFSHNSRHEVLFASQQALYRSDDQGRSWLRLSCGLILTGVAVSPRDPGTIYIAANPGVDYEHDSLGGLYRTTDGGQTWKRFTRFPKTNPAEPTVNVVAVDPTDPQHVFIGTEGGGLLRSTDGGEHWAFTRIARPGNGLNGPQLIDLAFGPGGSPALWGSSRFAGVFRGDRLGRSWSARGLKGAWVGQIVPDRRNPNVVYAVVQGKGAVRTLDGGKHWLRMKGLPPGIDGMTIATGDTLYAWQGRQIFRSVTQGANWAHLPLLPSLR
jgi:photosystem II stability/assembly factor-like uncharacterized protein